MPAPPLDRPTTLPRRSSNRILMWLAQVAQDRNVSPIGSKVAIALANGVEPSRLTVEMSFTEIAKAAAATRTSVAKAVAALHAHMHINIERVGSEDGTPARYGLRIHTAAMPIGAAMVTAPRKATKEEAARRRARKNRLESNAPPKPDSQLSSTQRAARREAAMRAKMRGER